MSHERFEELAPLYALGALDGEDLAAFEAHLPGCPECRGLVREYEEASTALPGALPQDAPSGRVRAAVLAARPASVRARPALRWGWLAAAAALVFAVFWFRTQKALDDLADLHRRQERAVEDLRRELEFERTASLAWMKGTPAAPDAVAFVKWRGREIRITAKGLKPLDATKTYELWAIADGKPVRAGEYSVGADGALTGSFRMTTEIRPGTVFAVTVEAAGGVDAPTLSAMALAPG